MPRVASNVGLHTSMQVEAVRCVLSNAEAFSVIHIRLMPSLGCRRMSGLPGRRQLLARRRFASEFVTAMSLMAQPGER
jgi:hypothetical protein